MQRTQRQQRRHRGKPLVGSPGRTGGAAEIPEDLFEALGRPGKPITREGLQRAIGKGVGRDPIPGGGPFEDLAEEDALRRVGADVASADAREIPIRRPHHAHGPHGMPLHFELTEELPERVSRGLLDEGMGGLHGSDGLFPGQIHDLVVGLEDDRIRLRREGDGPAKEESG